MLITEYCQEEQNMKITKYMIVSMGLFTCIFGSISQDAMAFQYNFGAPPANHLHKPVIQLTSRQMIESLGDVFTSDVVDSILEIWDSRRAQSSTARYMALHLPLAIAIGGGFIIFYSILLG